MLPLHSHHIVDVYSWVDNILPSRKYPKGGRPPELTDNECITILIWNVLVLHQKTFKDIHISTQMYLDREFPRLTTYDAFLKQCHRVTPMMYELLTHLLQDDPLRFVDSTMLPVCKFPRANDHKVAKNVAKYGKNHQGWHYGFKLHATTNEKGQLCSLWFSGANFYDAQALPFLVDENVDTLVGDTLYGASVMRKKIYDLFGITIISPPWPKQKKKVATPLQNILLNQRSQIEAVFGVLKCQLHLVTSFPRSVRGYFAHYVRILLGYQIMALLRG